MATDRRDRSSAGDGGEQLLGGLGWWERSAYVALLADARYRRFFFASLTSSLGDWVGVLAILALTETVVGRASRAAAFALSGVMVARILPMLVLGPVAGVYADRWDRKRTLIVTDVSRGLIMAVIPFAQDFFQLFVASFVIELFSMVFSPAKEATLPNIVARERLVQANQLTLIVTYGTLPLGGVLFAAFVQLRGLLPAWEIVAQRPESVAIWANALTFWLSAWLFFGMRFPPQEAPAQATETSLGTRALQEVKEGLRFVATRPRLRALIVGVMAAAFAGGLLFALAKLFVSVIGSGQSGFGLLVAVVGAGMLVGLLAAVPLDRHFGKDRLFGPGVGVGGAFAFVVALMPNLGLASAAAFVMGAGTGLAFVTGYTLLQENAGDEIRGRAFAVFHTGVRLALFLSLVVGPAVVGVLGLEAVGGYDIGGVRVTMAVGGLIAVAGAVWATRELERLHDRPRPQPTTGTGTFVVFEGGEGAGKSTQLRLLRDALADAGYDVVVTREPGGTELGEELRDLVLDPDRDVTDRTEALLYAAARAEHVAEVIRPALDKGAVVLCDRYVDSSIVYQGAVRGLGEDRIEELNRWATQGLTADLVVLLDIDAEEGLQRADGSTPDRLERQGVEFHRRVNEAFRQRAAADAGRFVVVDATGPAHQVHQRIRQVIFELLGHETETQA
ncbi:MAG: dTMP kinase [Actinobacteria bacterium]|nr:dTMP kinase [Actinomycetota bacterium]